MLPLGLDTLCNCSDQATDAWDRMLNSSDTSQTDCKAAHDRSEKWALLAGRLRRKPRRLGGYCAQRREVAGEFGPGGFDLSLQLVETGFNHD